MKRPLLAALLLAPLLGAASLPSAYADDEETREAAATVEDLHGQMSDMVLKTANGIDSFFGTERSTTFEENTSYIRLRLNFDWLETSGLDINPGVKLHVVLPGAMSRLRLIANDEEEHGGEGQGEEAEVESSIALRWIGFDSDRAGLNFDLGMRISDWTPAGFGRANVQFVLPLGGKWIARTTNRLYWYTDTGWRNDLRQYFEFQLSKNFFFRSRTRIQYFEEEGDELFPEQKLTLFQRLGDRQAIAYEALVERIPADDSRFDEEDIVVPDDAYTEAQLRMRYRVNLFRPWFHVELWPIVLFPEEQDYDLTWAARFRVEITFGHVTAGSVKIGE
jgi:hypothetical protein